MVALEVGFKLDNSLEYYDKLLKKHGAINCYNLETNDIYFTNVNLDNLSENQMKKSCIRLRMTRSLGGRDLKFIKKIKLFLGIKGKRYCRF